MKQGVTGDLSFFRLFSLILKQKTAKNWPFLTQKHLFLATSDTPRFSQNPVKNP
jgi:hypothetical protein